MFSDFPGGPEVKNPPANAGDTGSIPAPAQGRFHMLVVNWAGASQLLKPAPQEPRLHNKKSHNSEKPTHHNYRVAPAHGN